jgi:hypothetical protein
LRLSVLSAALLTTVMLSSGMPAADAASYRLNRIQLPDGTHQLPRWDPCQSITYKVNVTRVHGQRDKRQAIRVTKSSVARVAKANGLMFSFEGRTRVVPRSENLSGQDAANLIVAFVPPSRTDYPLSGATAGYGGWQASYREHDGEYVAAITRGFVVIDQTQTKNWPDGLHSRGVTRANLVSHELGHAVGLGHVDDRGQLMNPMLSADSPEGFARGDRRGLRRVGRAAGCIPGF